MTDEIKDAIDSAINTDALAFKKAIYTTLANKVNDAVETRKMDVASTLFTASETSEED